MRALWRLASWGGVATFALFTAVLSIYSHAGAERRLAAITSGQAPPAAGEARSAESTEETRRLAESVRSLTADRDQLITRVAALERNLDGVTGSIKRERADSAPTPSASALPNPPAAPGPPVRPETPAAPATEAAITPASSSPSSIAPPASPADAAQTSTPNPVHMAAPAEAATAAAKLGIDVGGGINFEGLRTLWRSTRNIDPALPEELYPVVNVRENGKTHAAELRLIVGPIGDAEEAERLCTTLAGAHHYCQPVAFEGQRLPLIDTPPAKPHHVATPPNVLSEAPTHSTR